MKMPFLLISPKIVPKIQLIKKGGCFEYHAVIADKIKYRYVHRASICPALGMPEQIQSPSMTADWEEKLLLIEKGEYASEDFMDEIKDVIAGLIQNYEVIRDSEVMMSKEANSIGKCPLCGSAVEDKAKAFFCSNRACKFALWKNNRYFASIGKSMTSATAQKLLGSGKVKLKNCKSERTGNTFDATVFMEVSDDGKTKFSMEFENGGKRK